MQQSGLLWYADFVNYLVSGLLPPYLNYHQKKRVFYDVRSYQWDEPYIYKMCSDHVIRRCVPDEEIPHILHLCHAAVYPHGSVDLLDERTGQEFKVNEHKVKHYMDTIADRSKEDLFLNDPTL